jgi:hypothetical protein
MQKPIDLREADFKRDIWKYSYPEVIKTEFFDYWSEPDRAASPKMRFEKEKTWALGRRLSRWVKNSKTVIAKNVHVSEIRKAPEPTNDVERLDAFITDYRKRPADIDFKLFGQWYDWLKERKLLCQMSKQEVELLQAVYINDNYKCRCAVVQKTLSGYINNGIRVKDLIQLRQNLQ